jgi:GSH-dependent disulfide-bond oxidoreductase
MIQLYTWKTPNGRKPAIFLEELGVPYNIVPVDISKNEQFAENFLKISPNNKIPGLVDGEVTIFESGAILTYLAEKFDKFLPARGPERYKVLEWTFWQVGGVGPMFGQLAYFAVRAKEKVPHAIDRFKEESDRLLGVLDHQLEKNTYLAGNMYTIADMATYPWIAAAFEMMQEPLSESIQKYKNVQRWLMVVGERPAVKRGMGIL